MDNIENNTKIPDSLSQMIDDIRYMLNESGEIIFIECLGTPGSGKTQYVTYLTKLLKDNNMGECVIRRTDPERKNDFYDKEDYSDLLKKRFHTVINDMSDKNKGKIIIYDRGLLDLIAWLNYDYLRARLTFKQYNEIGGDALNDDFYLKKMPMQIRKSIAKPNENDIMNSEELNRLLNVYSPISVAFNTTPEISIRKVDKKMYSIPDLECYNESLENLIYSIKDASQKCIYVVNDGYENKSFEDITFNVLKSIRDYLKLQVPKSPGKYIPFPEDPYPDDNLFH